MEIQKEIIAEDLQKQVKEHIREDLFDWDEALTEEEMIFLEQLLLTFAPMFNKGSIGFAKTIQPHLTALQSSLTEKDQQILIEFEKGVEFGCKQYEKIVEELKAENEHIKCVLKRFMQTIPIDNGNWYLPKFNEAKDEANELLNK